jgi:hypothetical protein
MAKEHRLALTDMVRAIVEHDYQSTARALASDADGGSEDNFDDLFDLVGMAPEGCTFCSPSVC